jgi:hypothetical protein
MVATFENCRGIGDKAPGPNTFEMVDFMLDLCAACGGHGPFCPCTSARPSLGHDTDFFQVEDVFGGSLQCALESSSFQQQYILPRFQPTFLPTFEHGGCLEPKADFGTDEEINDEGDVQELAPAASRFSAGSKSGRTTLVAASLSNLSRFLENTAAPKRDKHLDLKIRAEKAVRSAAVLHHGRTLENHDSREFLEFMQSSKDLVEIDKTVEFMEVIQDLCRQILKVTNPTKIRRQSSSLTSKASKFGRAFVIRMREVLYDHALGLLADREAKQMKSQHRQPSPMLKDMRAMENCWTRKLEQGGAKKIFARAHSESWREARGIASKRSGKSGRGLTSNHFAAMVAEKVFQLYFRQTGALYKTLVDKLSKGPD